MFPAKTNRISIFVPYILMSVYFLLFFRLSEFSIRNIRLTSSLAMKWVKTVLMFDPVRARTLSWLSLSPGRIISNRPCSCEGATSVLL